MPDDTMALFYSDVKDEFALAKSAKGKAHFEHLSTSVFVISALLADFFLVSVLSFMLSSLAFSATGHFGLDLFCIGTALTAAVLYLFKSSHLYKIETIVAPLASIVWIGKIWSVGLLCLAAVSVWLKTPDSHAVIGFVSLYAGGLAALAAERFVLARLFTAAVARGVVSHSVVVIGASELSAKLVEHLAGNRYGINVDAVFDDAISRETGDAHGLKIAGGVADVLRYHKSHRIDTAVIALPMDSSDRLRDIVFQLSMQPLNIRILPGEMALESPSGWHAPLGEIPGIQLMTIANRPISHWGFLVKSAMDRAFGFLALVFFGPVMLACALAIKFTSPGPIFYRQKRVGYRNRIFEVYKFRSMHQDACNTGRLTERNDPRIFKFGHIMRKFSLDELPQILNVLKGDMSLVGPRPHMPEARAAGQFYFDAVAAYASRHRVKPGITGWAQVNGWRGPTETIEQIEKRVSHDLFYIDNWSVGFDIVILAKTVFVGFFGSNAF